jgi:tetratricopeptide (TPR) repeat protein
MCRLCCLCLILASGVVFAGMAQTAALEAKAEKARAALAEERFEEAARLYAELVKSSPNSPALRLALAVAEQGCGRYAKAVEQLRMVLQQDPKFRGAWKLLAENLERLGDMVKAVDAYEQALKLEPSRLDLQLALASAYRKAGRPEQAADLFLHAARADPTEVRIWHGLGLAYIDLARTTRASLPREPSWNQRFAQPPPEKPDCPGDSLECRFARGEHWQLLDASRNDRSSEALYWQVRAYLALARRAFEQLADLPASPDTRPLFREAEHLYSQNDLALLEKP